jgi:hypothetical protein
MASCYHSASFGILLIKIGQVVWPAGRLTYFLDTILWPWPCFGTGHHLCKFRFTRIGHVQRSCNRVSIVFRFRDMACFICLTFDLQELGQGMIRGQRHWLHWIGDPQISGQRCWDHFAISSRFWDIRLFHLHGKCLFRPIVGRFFLSHAHILGSIIFFYHATASCYHSASFGVLFVKIGQVVWRAGRLTYFLDTILWPWPCFGTEVIIYANFVLHEL